MVITKDWGCAISTNSKYGDKRTLKVWNYFEKELEK
jgi:hypothetical protein